MKAKDKHPLKHLVIIPDGNRRWARQRNLFSWLGHEEGMKRIEEIAGKILKLEIPFFTFWIASKDNLLKRNKQEVTFLYKLFIQGFERLLNSKDVERHRVKFRIIGDWEEMAPEKLKKVIRQLLKKTSDYQKFNATFLLAYDGIQEMVEAIKLLAQKQPKEFNYEIIKERLSTSALPPVDYVIRTGGDPHNSAGFMMWHTAYSQYYFTPTLFPDFGKQELIKALKDFDKRERRFGK